MKHFKCIFLFSILFFSCDEINHVNDYFRDNFSFICVLKNDQAIQRAGLYKFVDIDSNYNYYRDFIQDAEITLSDGIISSQLKIREIPISYYFSEYFYLDDSVFNGKILPNTKYDIQIKVKDEIITGSTITPGEFVINIPNNTIELEKDADKYYKSDVTIYRYSLSLSESANSFNHYLVYTTITYKDENGENHSAYFPTNSADIPIIIEIPNIPDYYSPRDRTYYPESAKFTVIAVDKNYYDYYFLSRDRAGLSGQYGVFGSSIVDSCVVSVKY